MPQVYVLFLAHCLQTSATGRTEPFVAIADYSQQDYKKDRQGDQDLWHTSRKQEKHVNLLETPNKAIWVGCKKNCF
jgi:hypothetical protein